jgi:chromosome transmission fidelity protein 4
VWDVAARTVVSRTRHDAIVCAAAGRAEKNAVAMVDANGQWAEWTDVVPESMPTPFAPVGAEALDMSGGAPRDGREAVSEDDDADRADADADADDDLADMDEEAYYAEMDRRRAEKRRKADEKRREAATAAVLASNTAPGVVPTPQAPFQVGAVKAKTDAKAATATTSSAKEKTPASRRFLCYNMLGSVTSAGESGSDFNVIEMAFHDTSRRGRVPTITDYHGYDVAVLGERGCALASPGSKDGGAATVFYRPYESRRAPQGRARGERRRRVRLRRCAHLRAPAARLHAQRRAETHRAAGGRTGDVRRQGRLPGRMLARRRADCELWRGDGAAARLR